MAKPHDTKRNKWQLTAGTPCRFLERKHAVEAAKDMKLPYEIKKGPKPAFGVSGYSHTWELRVWQPTLWQGRKVSGSSNYNKPFTSKKSAMSSYRYGMDTWKLVRLPTGAYVFIELAAQTLKFGGKEFSYYAIRRLISEAEREARKLRIRGWNVRIVPRLYAGYGTKYLLYRRRGRRR